VATVALTDDHQALFIHLASDASQSYQRDLILHGTTFNPGTTAAGGCEIERILVHGKRPYSPNRSDLATDFAMSSCYGYASSGP
jgi:hypothetical protein